MTEDTKLHALAGLEDESVDTDYSPAGGLTLVDILLAAAILDAACPCAHAEQSWVEESAEDGGVIMVRLPPR